MPPENRKPPQWEAGGVAAGGMPDQVGEAGAAGKIGVLLGPAAGDCIAVAEFAVGDAGVAHDHGARTRVDQEGGKLVGIGNAAEGRIAGEATIGCKSRAFDQLAETGDEGGGGRRLGRGDTAAEDGDRPVGGIADQRAAGRKPPLQRGDQLVADAG